jgi:hypothetical protein
MLDVPGCTHWYGQPKLRWMLVTRTANFLTDSTAICNRYVVNGVLSVEELFKAVQFVGSDICIYDRNK